MASFSGVRITVLWRKASRFAFASIASRRMRPQASRVEGWPCCARQQTLGERESPRRGSMPRQARVLCRLRTMTGPWSVASMTDCRLPIIQEDCKASSSRPRLPGGAARLVSVATAWRSASAWSRLHQKLVERVPKRYRKSSSTERPKATRLRAERNTVQHWHGFPAP